MTLSSTACFDISIFLVRQALDAELRRLRGEIKQKESKTAESFWQRSVAADREKMRLETELDQAQAKASRA